MLRNELKIALRYTLITTLVLGIFYPLTVAAFAHLIFPWQANGELLLGPGGIVGSKLIGQSFTTARYFHSRPSAAGNGYDATASGGSNLSPSSQKLVTRIEADASAYAAAGNGKPVPIDLVTASGSGLDPDISPAAALFQVTRVAAARHLAPEAVRRLVLDHVEKRQFGVMGQPRVNVLSLNLALDRMQAA